MKNGVLLQICLLLILPGCIAQSPSDNPVGSKVSSESILNQILDGQSVIYDGVEIGGDISLSSLNLLNGKLDTNGSSSHLQIVNSSISITNSTFKGKFSLPGVFFKKPVKLNDNTFKEDANLEGAVFQNKSSFNYSKFEGVASFSRSYFYEVAHFENCKFEEESSFSGSIYKKDARYSGAKFSDTSFKDAFFSGNTIFGDTKFMKYATFENSTFLKSASFNKASFMEKSDLFSSRFVGKAYFFDAAFFDTVSFSESFFRDSFFNNARFIGNALFLNTSFLGPVSFLGSNFEQDALFFRANFSSKITLDGCTFDKLVLHWSAIRDHLVLNENAESIFNKLIGNYKTLGWLADANECYFDLRKWKQERTEWTAITKVPDIFLENYCGYGTRPLLAVFWILPVILFFGFMYWLKGGISQTSQPDLARDKLNLIARKLSEKTFQIEYIPTEPKKDASPYKSLARSIYFSFLVFASWNVGNMQTEERAKSLVAWERRIGLALFTIFTYYVGKYIISYFMPGI
jgi:uncharacterized protein YjbI with pentapeptide repeats